MNMSYHCQVQRANRVQHIINDIGLGQVIKEKYVRSDMNKAGRYLCITDTGITIVKSEDKQTIITMYVTTQKELVMVYAGTKKIPPFLRKRVDTNQSKYTEDGRTIWR